MDSFLNNVKRVIDRDLGAVLEWFKDLEINDLNPKDLLIIHDGRLMLAVKLKSIGIGVCWDTLNAGLDNFNTDQFDSIMDDVPSKVKDLLSDSGYTELSQSTSLTSVNFILGENVIGEAYNQYSLMVVINKDESFTPEEMLEVIQAEVVVANLAAVVLVDYVTTNNLNLNHGPLKN